MQWRQGYPLSLNPRGLHDSPRTHYIQHSARQHYAANAAKICLKAHVVRYDVVVIVELFLADGAFSVLRDNLAVEQFPQFCW
jgi:hypothetical protein